LRIDCPSRCPLARLEISLRKKAGAIRLRLQCWLVRPDKNRVPLWNSLWYYLDPSVVELLRLHHREHRVTRRKTQRSKPTPSFGDGRSISHLRENARHLHPIQRGNKRQHSGDEWILNQFA